MTLIRCSLRFQSPGDRFTKVNVSLRSSLVISLRAPIRAFHQTSHNLKSYDIQLPTSNISYNGGKKLKISYDI
jgi:hypothetical protein